MYFHMFFRRVIVYFTILVLSVAGLTACAGTQPYPMYSFNVAPLKNYAASDYGITQPTNSQQILRAEGNYHAVEKPLTDIERWHQQQVANTTLIFFDADDQYEHQTFLYKFTENNIQYVELDVSLLSNQTTLLAIYESIYMSTTSLDHASWWQRFWRWYRAGQNLLHTESRSAKCSRGLIFARLYESILLKPMLNVFLMLRVPLPVDDLVTLVVFQSSFQGIQIC
jgi:hypothetical protein